MRWKIVVLALLLIATVSTIAIGYEMKKKENIVGEQAPLYGWILKEDSGG
jgi:hypothetical protein